MDQPVAALLKDLKQRGLLDETLVVWGGEFGRTLDERGRAAARKFLGRDHHPHCFTHLDGRRRHQGGHHLRRRPTTWATSSPRTRSTSTTCRRRSCTCWASTPKLTYPYQGLKQRLIGPEGEAKVRREILA